MVMQLDRMIRIAPIAGLGLMLGNLAIVVSNLIVWRIGNYYLTVGLVALTIGAGILVVANLWATKWDMIRKLRNSQIAHDPVQVYQLTPKERVVLELSLWQMEHQILVGRSLGVPHERLMAATTRLSDWLQKGEIPAGDFAYPLGVYDYRRVAK